MPKVSVVIPIYNVEAYIERCLHSLFGQTFDDMEYIFVDDGSTDGSVSILERVLEQYPARREQTKILHNDKPQGVAAARTTGIRAATGEYIIHCDPDDWVERDMYEKLYTEAVRKDVDIVACYFMVEWGDKNYVEPFKYRKTPQASLKGMYKQNIIYSSLCDKLVRRSIVTAHDIVPFCGVDFGEDLNCAVRILYYAKSISVVREPLYHYCRRGDSLSLLPKSREVLEKRMLNADKICEFLHKNGGREYDAFCAHMKLSLKREYQSFFYENDEEWFNLYHDSYKHIFTYDVFPFRSRLIIWLAMRNFRLYRIMRRMFYDI